MNAHRMLAVAVVATALSVIMASNTQAANLVGAASAKNSPDEYLELTQVSADAVGDAWAIGDLSNDPAVLHWDGSTWSRVSIELPSGETVALRAITAISPTDVWLVGELQEGGGTSATLTEHWDGTAFSIVPSPNGPNRGSYLSAVSASASDDVWAVGWFGTEPLIERWDGTRWSVVQSKRHDAGMIAVDAIARDDVWASGFSGGPSFVVHWDGQRWQKSHLHHAGEFAAVSSDDVWAAGGHHVSQWDGTQWTGSPLGRGLYDSVTAPAADDVWVAGKVVADHGEGRVRPAIEHWDGQQWARYTVLDRAQEGTLYSISAASPTDIWAVGWYDTDAGRANLVLHWDGTSWKQYRV